jgi:hypothetical protein
MAVAPVHVAPDGRRYGCGGYRIKKFPEFFRFPLWIFHLQKLSIAINTLNV